MRRPTESSGTGYEPGVGRRATPMGEGGFTLVEAVVAVTIVVLVAGLVLTTYLLAVQQVSRWREGLALESHAHVAAQRVVSDLGRAARVAWEEDELVIVALDSSRVTYALSDSVLTRQGRPMHGPEVRVTEWSAAVEDGRSLRAGGEGEFPGAPLGQAAAASEEPGPVYVEVALAFADRRRTVRIVTGSAIRSPRGWP